MPDVSERLKKDRRTWSCSKMLCRLKCSLANPCIFVHLSYSKCFKLFSIILDGKHCIDASVNSRVGFLWVYFLFWTLSSVNRCCDKHAWRISWDKYQFSNIHGNVKTNSNKSHLLQGNEYPLFVCFFPLILYQRANMGFKQSLLCSHLLDADFS